MNKRLLTGLITASLIAGLGTAHAAVMEGFPASGDTQVTASNWTLPTFNQWAFRNVGIHRNRDETLNDLVSGDVHLAIMPHRSKITPEKQICYRNLGMLPLSFYVGKHHPLATNSEVSLKDLQLNKQYISENHLRAGIDMMRISPHQHIISNNDVLIALLKHQGWAVLSRIFAEEYVEKGDLVELALTNIVNPHRHGLSLYYPAQLEHDPTIKQFIDWFTGYAKQYMG